MNKRGYAQILGFIIIIFLVIEGVNLVSTLAKPESTLLELGEICPINEKNYNLCFNKNGDLLLKGEIKDDVDLQLKINENKITCNVGNDNLRVRTVCKNEFGYFIKESNFEIDFIINNIIMASLNRNQLKMGLVGGYLTNPKTVGKR